MLLCSNTWHKATHRREANSAFQFRVAWPITWGKAWQQEDEAAGHIVTICKQAAEIDFQRFHLPKILQSYKIAPPHGERVLKHRSPWGQACHLWTIALTHSNTEKGKMPLRKNVCANMDLCLRYTFLLKGWLENSMGMAMDGSYAPMLLLHLSRALWSIRFQLWWSIPNQVIADGHNVLFSFGTTKDCSAVYIQPNLQVS